MTAAIKANVVGRSPTPPDGWDEAVERKVSAIDAITDRIRFACRIAENESSLPESYHDAAMRLRTAAETVALGAAQLAAIAGFFDAARDVEGGTIPNGSGP